MDEQDVTVHPLVPERWHDLERVFGPNGAIDGCWCMWFRETSEEYRKGRGEPNRRALEAIVKRGDVPGLLAYVDGEPAAWCAVQPRSELKRLDRSRVTKSPDGAESWAIVCFVTRGEFRRRGITRKLLEAAVAYAAQQGATLVEGFPVDATGKLSAGDLFHGAASTFEACGFSEEERRTPKRPYMRRVIG